MLVQALNENLKPAIFKHQDVINITKAQEDLLEAQEEWDYLDNISHATEDKAWKFITYDEVWNYFQTKDMSEYMKNIQPVCSRKGIALLLHWLWGPSRMHQSLNAERNLIFAIAQYPLDCKSSFHVRALQTLYKQLTGFRGFCPIHGKHWEEIGFQGNDPSTDTRGVGFFAIVQLLYMILNTHTSQIAKDIYRLSQDTVQNFPFCAMSINITRISLEALREGALNKICNQRKEVISVVNEFYVGTFLYLYNIWKREHKTILDSGFVIKDVTAYVKKNSSAVLQNVQNFHQKRKSSIPTDIAFSKIEGIT